MTKQTSKDKLYQYMNHMKLSRKLTLLYVFCVLLPLVVTDSILLYIVLNNESVKQKHAMENEARAIQYSLTNDIDYAAAVAKQIYMNEYIESLPAILLGLTKGSRPLHSSNTSQEKTQKCLPGRANCQQPKHGRTGTLPSPR